MLLKKSSCKLLQKEHTLQLRWPLVIVTVSLQSKTLQEIEDVLVEGWLVTLRGGMFLSCKSSLQLFFYSRVIGVENDLRAKGSPLCYQFQSGNPLHFFSFLRSFLVPFRRGCHNSFTQHEFLLVPIFKESLEKFLGGEGSHFQGCFGEVLGGEDAVTTPTDRRDRVFLSLDVYVVHCGI